MPNSRRPAGDPTGSAHADAPAESPRLRELIDDIARRLRPICGHLPGAEFDALVRQTAELTYQYEVGARHE
jgi:hypothetical protein